MRMTWVIIGLGNPDEEYARTRHNAGRMMVQKFAEKHGFSEWKEESRAKSFIARGMVGKSIAVGVLPNTYMNKSGIAAAHYIKSVKAAEKLIVVYDDLDLPIGSLKISFDRGSGGHKGIDSIATAVKTKRFVRIRVGISKENKDGAAKKPQGEAEVEKFILGEFKADEMITLKSVFKKAGEALEMIVSDGREIAMNKFN
jgi:PTH1 family peptidyl-tRNA hydrolase